ncbi:MAG: kinetochore protein SPC24 [Gammaproteobacteria bacterium]|nr:kinetochore protein SPC24 [Gammaproteobacteria bacterium]
MTEDKNAEIDNALLQISDDENAVEFLRKELERCKTRLSELARESDSPEKANIKLEMSNALLGLSMNVEAWNEAKEAFIIFIENELWPQAVEACDILYQTDQPASIIALAHGVWLSVTYPIEPEQSIVMLNYIIEETPANSDGAAVAAATAHYIVGLRSDSDKHDSLSFLTTNMIAKVAQRHSDVKSQEALDFWMNKLDLKDPAVFLPRMGMILNAIVGEDWWFDREALRAKLPVN